MVDCSEFLDAYSDYRDGLLEQGREAEFTAHLRSCASCARYDHVVGRGIEVFRDIPQLTPSPDFHARLQHRIFHLEDDLAAHRHASGASLGVTLLICAAIALGAWLPRVRTEPGPVRLPPVVAHAPYHHHVVPLLIQRGPLLARDVYSASLSRYGAPMGVFQAPVQEAVAAQPASVFYYPRR